MPMNRIKSVRVTLADGTEHVWEGEGTLNVHRTYRLDDNDRKIAVGRVEAVMPIPAEFNDSRITITPGTDPSL